MALKDPQKGLEVNAPKNRIMFPLGPLLQSNLSWKKCYSQGEDEGIGNRPGTCHMLGAGIQTFCTSSHLPHTMTLNAECW